MTRMDYNKVAPGVVKAVYALEQYVRTSGLEPALIELVKLRASLMNGCAYCVDMHTKDARAKGETEQRLFAVPVWRETPFFSPRERAALAWTEAVTDIGRNGVSDALYDEARAQFSRQGTGRPDRGRHRDQRMEPSRRDVPARGGQLQACSRHDCGFRLKQGRHDCEIAATLAGLGRRRRNVMLTVIATQVAVTAGSHRDVRSRLASLGCRRPTCPGSSSDTIVQ